jgi:hypothetical protein
VVREGNETYEIEESNKGTDDDGAVADEAEGDDGAASVLEVPDAEHKEEDDTDDEHGDDRT